MKQILLSRWTQTLAGTALLGGIVWTFGPLWPPLEPWLPRLLVIQSMLVVWAVANALIDARRRSREAALAAGLLGAAEGEEGAAVGATLRDALGALRKSGRRTALAELPWYAIIGPPGAGKTTALLNAGLRFTLAEQLGKAAVPGVGGTRLCEWWFTDRAVLVDTAGRYTTQDSDAAVDKAGWDAFLGLLKRTRPRQPLNGLIVAMALPEVVQATVAERDAHADTIKRRIGELQARFGLRMPIYALFTKADLIAGFTEFFDGLDRDGREQVWGETFPFAATTMPAAERFPGGFHDLVRRLNEQMLIRLGAERRPDRRGAIVGFPTQVASLERPLAAFVAAAFPPASTLLRGVYFASGTQEGTPIDRLRGAMARAFGVEGQQATAPRPESGRSFFLGRLLRDVIFNEAMLVREPPRALRTRRLLRVIGFALVLLAVGGVAAPMLSSYRAGTAQVSAMAAALAGYEAAAPGASLDPVSDGDLRPLASLLDRALAMATHSSASPVGFGMDQAGKLDAGAGQIYRDGLVYGLLPRLVWRLETQMRGDLGRPDALYELTRIYLMLGGAGPLNAPLVRNWAVRDWQQAFPEPEDDALRAGLVAHLDRLLAEPLPPVTLDTALVAAARASFSQVPLADRVYATVRATPAAAALPAWRPVELLGLAGVQVFTRASGKPMTEGIPGLYTAAGFRTVLVPSVAAASKRVAAETWVSGRHTEFAPAELQNLQTAVEALYAKDFTAQWDAMLADLNVGPMTTIPQAAQALYILASPESPLRALVQSAAAQLRLLPPGAAGGGTPPIVQAVAHFGGLIDLGTGDGAALERGLRLVADFQQQLAKIAALPIGALLPPGGNDIGTALTVEAARQPQPLARWLQAIAANAQALRTGNTARQLALTFNAPGGPGQACQAAMSHYPFAPGGTPLPLADFANVFGPGGALDGFFNTQLKPFVDVAASPWRPQAAAPVSPGDVAQFQRANTIRSALFPSGLSTPSISFEIAPAGPVAGRTMLLDLAGITVEAGNGPAHTAAVTWPPLDPAATSSLTAVPPLPSGPLTETGPWALFRLFSRGRFSPSGKPGRQVLSFTAGNASVSFALQMGEHDPFAPGLFTDFRCPALQ